MTASVQIIEPDNAKPKLSRCQRIWGIYGKNMTEGYAHVLHVEFEVSQLSESKTNNSDDMWKSITTLIDVIIDILSTLLSI